MRVERHGVAKQFHGDLVKLTDRWIVLRRISVSASCHEIPVLSTIPLVGGSLFIPRCPSATTNSFGFRATPRPSRSGFNPKKPVVVKGPEGDDPMTKVACAVELVAGKKMIQREGGMQDVAADNVTVAVTTTIPYVMPDQRGRIVDGRQRFEAAEIPLHPRALCPPGHSLRSRAEL